MSYNPNEPLRRECPKCLLVRFPEKQIVKKNGKQWIIYTCRICKMQDIEEYNRGDK